MELRQKERELFEIRPNSAVLQSSKTSVEFPKGEDTKKELFEAYDKIKNLPVQNTKYANELNELKKEFDTIIQEVGVLKESNSKLENELVLAKEDNLKLKYTKNLVLDEHFIYSLFLFLAKNYRNTTLLWVNYIINVKLYKACMTKKKRKILN